MTKQTRPEDIKRCSVINIVIRDIGQAVHMTINKLRGVGNDGKEKLVYTKHNEKHYKNCFKQFSILIIPE